MNALADRLRDPLGWLLDALPWPLRRVYFAARLREWPWNVADSVRIIGCRRPPQHVFDYFNELERRKLAADLNPGPASDTTTEGGTDGR